MTDDNVLAPQLIKFPGIPSQRVDTPISTLDLFPTVLEYLDIQANATILKFPLHGISLLNKIKQKEAWQSRYMRIDNRYIFQSNIVTALRNESYKYVFYEEEKREEFFYIDKDPMEEVNLNQASEYENVINDFKDIYTSQKNDILNYHTNILEKKFREQFSENENYLLIGNFNEFFITIYTEIFLRIGMSFNLIQLPQSKGGTDVKIYSSYTDVTNCNVIAFPVDKDHKINSDIIEYAQKLSNSNVCFVNYNLDKVKPPKHWGYKLLEKPRQYFWTFKNHPKTALANLRIDVIKLFNYIKK
jgi:hypothetical protein